MVNKHIKGCFHCGTSLIQLQTTHRVGCPICYDSFREEISSIQGDRFSRNEGDESPSIFHEQLKFRLDQALFREEYELAAQLRDELARTGGNEFSAEE